MPVTYRLGSPGRHVAMNSLGVLAVCEALGGGPDARDCRRLAEVTPPSGRGEQLGLSRRAATSCSIDESYNANPASMRAALAMLGQAPVGLRRPADRGARRHAGTRAGGPRCMPACVAALEEQASTSSSPPGR